MENNVSLQFSSLCCYRSCLQKAYKIFPEDTTSASFHLHITCLIDTVSLQQTSKWEQKALLNRLLKIKLLYAPSK